MDEKQLAALAALSGATSGKQESKTIDYKVSMANKNGEVKSVGIFKIWKRFSEAQMAQIVARLSADGVMIEVLNGSTATSDDEF